jgi:uncharacterized protein (TIGR01244 family)
MKGNAPPAVAIAAACMFLVVPREAPAQAASESPATGQPAPITASPAVPAWHHPREGLVTGGQPAPAEWAELKAQGVTTIINLRPPAEMAGRNEAAEVGATGMAYIELPVAGAEDIDADNARRLWSLLKASPAPVFVHCASGNRVGALLALGAAQSGAMGADAALEFGRSAGLRGLEPVVRERLGLPPAD